LRKFVFTSKTDFRRETKETSNLGLLIPDEIKGENRSFFHNISYKYTFGSDLLATAKTIRLALIQNHLPMPL